MPMVGGDVDTVECIENGKKYNVLAGSFVKEAVAVERDSENNWHVLLLVKQLKAVMFHLFTVTAQKQSSQVPFIMVAFEPVMTRKTFGIVLMFIVLLSTISIVRARIQTVRSLRIAAVIV